MLRKIFAKVSGKTEQQIMNDQLRTAAIKGNLARVQKLVKEGAEIDYKDVNGMTPLWFAVGRGHLEVTRFLLEQGADPNVAREDTLGPPLVMAAAENRVELVKLLLDFKADINTINYSRRTALHEAAWHSKTEAAMLLLERGADPNTIDRLDMSPLRGAVTYDNRVLALALAEHGADGTVEYQYGEDVNKKITAKGWDDVALALENYRTKAAREAAAEKAALDKSIAAAPVLQNDIAVKKPLIIKPKAP
jgi:ankyrin repeat protein